MCQPTGAPALASAPQALTEEGKWQRRAILKASSRVPRNVGSNHALRYMKMDGEWRVSSPAAKFHALLLHRFASRELALHAVPQRAHASGLGVLCGRRCLAARGRRMDSGRRFEGLRSQTFIAEATSRDRATRAA